MANAKRRRLPVARTPMKTGRRFPNRLLRIWRANEPPRHGDDIMRVMKNVWLTAAGVAMVLLQACVMAKQAKVTQTQHVDHVAGTALKVESRNGSVEIAADKSRGDVEVNATITCSGDDQTQADARASQASVSISRDSSQALVI